MCRNIRVLYNFEPPTTEDEIRAAAVQYVRKVSGLARPPAVDVVIFALFVRFRDSDFSCEYWHSRRVGRRRRRWPQGA